jgi:fatty-acyl-CoA synthase
MSVRAHRPADPAVVEETTVASILRRAAAEVPENSALVAGDGSGRRWSYAALCAEAEQAAGALAAAFAPGERLAVVGPSLPESLVCSYAAAMARLVLVPVNPALRAGELAHVLGQSGAAGCIGVERWRDAAPLATIEELQPSLPALRQVIGFGDWADFAGSAPPLAPDAPAPDPSDVAQIVYTSGTTGAPKGAMLTHRGMTNAARLGGIRFGMRSGDVFVQTMPLFHVGGQVVSFEICQHRAVEVLLTSFDPGVMLELVEAERATLTCGVPTMLLSLIEHPDFARRDLSSLRSVSSGGAAVPTELVRHIESSLGVSFTIVFGQTEACGFISQTHLDDPDEVKAASLGTPLPGIEARVVDDEGDVVGLGEPGELEVRGPNVMAGYHDMAEATAEALRGDGWLRTGDVVDMDAAGVLRIRGRRKDMIVSGGENIFPVEIEDVLMAHPAVAQAAVVGVSDRRWGEAAVAVIRPVPGANPVPTELEAYLRERLAAFKVPRRWAVVEELPLTASGKVRKHVLREQLEAASGQQSASTA